MSTNDATGLLVVISGPSGVGKTTIVHRVKEAFNATFSVSATTRPKSESEEDGVDYFFITDEAFDQMVKESEFLEFAEVFGCHRYGTPKLPVLQAMERGEVVLLDIDVQGGIQVFENMPESLRVFIMPRAFERSVILPLSEEAGAPDQVLEALYVPSPEPHESALIAPPHPQMGGSMESPVLSDMAWACQEVGVASLRFNWRGVGASSGRPSGEASDADLDFKAGLDFLAETVPGR